MNPKTFAIGWTPHLSVTRVGSIWLWQLLGASIVSIGGRVMFTARQTALSEDHEDAQ